MTSRVRSSSHARNGARDNDRRVADANFQQWSVSAAMAAVDTDGAMPRHSPFDRASAAMAVGSPTDREWRHCAVFVGNVSSRVDSVELVRIFSAVGVVRMVSDPWFLSLATPTQRRYVFIL